VVVVGAATATATAAAVIVAVVAIVVVGASQRVFPKGLLAFPFLFPPEEKDSIAFC
jgi:hypothetical protein